MRLIERGIYSLDDLMHERKIVDSGENSYRAMSPDKRSPTVLPSSGRITTRMHTLAHARETRRTVPNIIIKNDLSGSFVRSILIVAGRNGKRRVERFQRENREPRFVEETGSRFPQQCDTPRVPTFFLFVVRRKYIFFFRSFLHNWSNIINKKKVVLVV